MSLSESDEHERLSARNSRSELAAIGLLVVVFVLFVAPLLFRWAPAVLDDAAVETLPGLIRVARAVQSGSLPLWDTSTFAGAKPTYVDNGWLIFYPPMYPFFLLADANKPANSHVVLMLVPYALHLLWAAIGGYLFARLVLGANRVAALLAGLIYGLSPEMGYQLSMTPAAITLSHLPWCCLAIARYLDSGSVSWWIGGSLLLALLSSGGNPNYLIREYFVLSVTALLVWLTMVYEQLRARTAGSRLADSNLVFRLAGVISMLALGIGLTGFAWAGSLESAWWIQNSIPETLSADAAARAARHSSMHPLNLATLLIPNYFGASDTLHFWGIGFLLTKHVTLSGGMFAMVAAIGGAASWLFRRPADPRQSALWRWTWVATVIFVAGIFTMLGRYTLVFRGFCLVFPWFFEFPHPVYYRFAVCWSTALLVGIGITTLMEFSSTTRLWRRVAMICVAVGLAAAGVGLACGYDGRWVSTSGWQSLGIRQQWDWFLSHGVLYLGAASLGLIVAPRLLTARGFGWCLALVVTAETLYIAWTVFYATTYLGPQQDITDPAGRERCYLPVEDPRLQRLLPFARSELGDREYRFVGQRSVFDNLAWYVDSRALLGYAAKPLMPDFAEIVQQFTELGNVIRFDDPPKQLLRNMNVRYLVVETPQDDDAMNFDVQEMSGVMPYVSTQSRIVPLQLERQLEKLLTEDLRQRVYIDPASCVEAPWSYASAESSGQSSIEAFERLQQQNVVQSVRHQGANRLIINVNVVRPSMLIINECWHPGWKATIDGGSTKIYRVNHIQQAIWLEAGEHTVALRFFPTGLKVGLAVSTISVLLLIAVGYVGYVMRAGPT